MTEDLKKRKGRGRAQTTLNIVTASYEILEAIQPASVRAVCYQLFNRKFLKDMSKGETAKVSKILTRARENGEIPWDWIVDETREKERVSAWRDLRHFRETVVKAYRQNFWLHQPEIVEVWSEKGTVRGTLAPVLKEFGVSFSVKHGFDSSTSVHLAAEQTRDLDRPMIVLYVGDWDPSGLCMSNADLPRRLREYGANIDLRRVCLTSADIGPSLPSFPAHERSKDPRYKWFTREFGDECWELDAMNPNDLRDRVRNEIMGLIDRQAWDRCLKIEKDEKKALADLAWPGDRKRSKPPRPKKRKPSLGKGVSGLFVRWSQNTAGGSP
jgi:hypothetical protein